MAQHGNRRGCKMEKGTSVVVATPSPINPLKTTLGLSVIHSMPGDQPALYKQPVRPGQIVHTIVLNITLKTYEIDT